MALRMISSAKERKRWRGDCPDVGEIFRRGRDTRIWARCSAVGRKFRRGWTRASGGATSQEEAQRIRSIRSGAAVGDRYLSRATILLVGDDTRIEATVDRTPCGSPRRGDLLVICDRPIAAAQKERRIRTGCGDDGCPQGLVHERSPRGLVHERSPQGLVHERSPQEVIRGGRRPVRKIALNKRSVDEQKLGSTSG